MKLISNDLRDGDKLPHRHVFNGMGYDGDNISPHLAWDNVPMGTKSFVVTCYDPDAPTGSGWWHWVVVNLPADTRVLTQGFGSGLVAVPDGVIQTRTDFGKAGYGGAAPPKGETHRYIFTVHALDVERLDVDEDASGAMVGLTCISIRSPAPRSRRCSVKRCAGWRRKRLTLPTGWVSRISAAPSGSIHIKSGTRRCNAPCASSAVAHSISGAKKRSCV